MTGSPRNLATTAWPASWNAVAFISSTPSTLRADQQGCQKGLLEDHSGGYRIEPLRPAGAAVDHCPPKPRDQFEEAYRLVDEGRHVELETGVSSA